ncbi:MAG: PAC2 family protein [Asgard group archaeon]|nr:PAC2 family protein [Asgard group archaeon]
MSNENPNIIIKKKNDFDLQNGVLVQCFPGQGLVGRIAGMHLIEAYKAKEAVRIYSSYFPHLVIFQGELGKLIHAELWAIENTTPPLLILTGESQPREGPQGMFEILSAVLDIAEEWGVKSVYAIGGFKAAKKQIKSDVTAFAYTEENAEFLKDNDVRLFTEGRVSGAVGVLTALAAERDMRSIGIMGKVTPSEGPSIAFGVDPNASKNALNLFSKLTGFEMDLDEMDKMIKDIEKTEARAMKVIEKLEQRKEEQENQKSFYL